MREAAKEALLAISSKGNETVLTCLTSMLTRTEWYSREIAIICIKDLTEGCRCQILDGDERIGVEALSCQCRCEVQVLLVSSDAFRMHQKTVERPLASISEIRD